RTCHPCLRRGTRDGTDFIHRHNKVPPGWFSLEKEKTPYGTRIEIVAGSRYPLRNAQTQYGYLQLIDLKYLPY
ncbi:hypothetical protein, partial [Klebsiella pneumoniae]|uniref:hypothetical protein n=1 Tax=Klebsiella pneumoniae TaxID=573 RepID=UPI002542D25D